MKEPDKWCIKVTPENKEAIEKWRTAKAILSCRGYCVNKNSFDDPSIGYWYPNKPEGYTEISFEEFKVYTSKPKDLTGRYVKCLVDGAQGTNCKAGEIYKLVSLDNIVETQLYKLEDGLCLCISPTTTDKWELLPEDYSADKPLKQAVHCKTQEEWDFVKDKLKATVSEFKKYGDCIDINAPGTSFYASQCEHNILSFQEWCDLNGYKMEKEVKFEVGKWYRGDENHYIRFLNIKNYGSYNQIQGEIIGCRKYEKIGYWASNLLEKEALKNGPLTDLSEIQQYLPEGHPDKIKSNQEFKVGDWVVVLEEDDFYYNSEKCPQKLMELRVGYSLPYRLLFKDGHNNSYKKIRHATEKEMQEYFRKNEDLLKKEIEATNEYLNEILDRMGEETPKSSCHLLSVDDEELPMVNIIKTNTVKQLLNSE